MAVKGTIVKVSGPLIVASGMADVNMYDVVRVSEKQLIGEVIELRGDKASIQVYEETGGIGPGEPVESTGAPLSVELAPGLIESIYDGIQRPLNKIQELAGDRITRGIRVDSIDHERLWDFRPAAQIGDILKPGDILGTVQETEAVLHKIMVPPNVEGQLTWIHSGDLGSIDEDGYLFIKGRIKRMITRADGHKIFPVALEGIIGRHRDVLSCAVVGVRDRLHAQGMQALAVIQLRPDADTEKVRAELFAMLEYEAEERGRPQFMEFVGEMPRAGMGKIDYKKLADDFEKTRTA